MLMHCHKDSYQHGVGLGSAYPSNGVKPIVVSTLLPFSTAHMLAPAPADHAHAHHPHSIEMHAEPCEY